MEAPTQLRRGGSTSSGVLAPPHWAVRRNGRRELCFLRLWHDLDTALLPPAARRGRRPLGARPHRLRGCTGRRPADAGTTSPSPRRRSTVRHPDAVGHQHRRGLVYVAVGASETVGIGADNPQREAWPVVLHRHRAEEGRVRQPRCLRLDRRPGARRAAAGGAGRRARRRHRVAGRQRPDPPGARAGLRAAARAPSSTSSGATAGRRCWSATCLQSSGCPPSARACPMPPAGAVPCQLPVVPEVAEIRAVVTTYNAAIARVAKAEGATLVDLSKGRDLTELTGTDGFHPSTAGHRLVAAAVRARAEGLTPTCSPSRCAASPPTRSGCCSARPRSRSASRSSPARWC